MKVEVKRRDFIRIDSADCYVRDSGSDPLIVRVWVPEYAVPFSVGICYIQELIDLFQKYLEVKREIREGKDA